MQFYTNLPNYYRIKQQINKYKIAIAIVFPTLAICTIDTYFAWRYVNNLHVTLELWNKIIKDVDNQSKAINIESDYNEDYELVNEYLEECLNSNSKSKQIICKLVIEWMEISYRTIQT